MEIGSETIVRRVDLPGSLIQDEIVIFDPEAGKYYATGTVGADIWEQLESPRTFAALCDHLVASYDVDRETCESEVRAFLTQMLDVGMISLERR